MNIENLLFWAVIAIIVLVLLLGLCLGWILAGFAESAGRELGCNHDCITDDLQEAADHLLEVVNTLQAEYPRPDPAAPATPAIEEAVGAKA